MPLAAAKSTSAWLAPVRIVLTRLPLLLVSSSVPASVTVAPLLRVGASLTAVTASDTLAELAENAVLPPLPAVVA